MALGRGGHHLVRVRSAPADPPPPRARRCRRNWPRTWACTSPGRRPATARRQLRPDGLPAGQAAEPGRLLQRLGGALRQASSRSRPTPMAPSPSCRSTPPLRRSRAIAARHLRRLPAHLRRQRPGLRPRGSHRLRPRDEHHPLPVGLQARPAAGFVARMAAHRDAVPQRGRRQRHLAVDVNRTSPAPGRSP